MSSLKSAHDLPKEGQSLASLPGSAALGRAKMILAVVGGLCTLLFVILALALPSAKGDKGTGHDHNHDHDGATAQEQAIAPAIVAAGHGDEVLAEDHADALAGAGESEGTFQHWKASMAYSWLFAIVFFMTLCVGGIFWTLLHNASNSGWGVLVRRLMENLGSVIPLLFALALPLVILPGPRDALWEWLPKQAGIAEHAKGMVMYRTDDGWGDDKPIVAETVAAYAAKVVSAKTALANVEKEVEAQMAGASPNLAFYLEQKVEVAKELVAVAEQEGQEFSDPDDVREHLIEEHEKHADILLYKKQSYLNKNFWMFRYVFYAFALSGIILLLRYWSVRQDHTGEAKYTLLSRRWSCGMLPLFAVAWTFLVFDWLMGLDYTWFSTMWGVYLFAGCALSSMSLLIAVMTLLIKHGAFNHGPFKGLITKEHYWIMGKLMHSFVIFWAYIAFSQFFLIWYANITEETKFYLTRNTDFWNTYSIAFLVIGHFVLPFAVLLLRKVKTTPKFAVTVCLWNILMQIFDIYWIIIPERGISLTHGARMTIPGVWILDILAWVAVGGLACAFFLHRLGQVSLYPSRDPRLDESLNLVN